jgi:virginiamycin B lyase
MLASVLVLAVASAAGATPITEFSSGLPTGSSPDSLTTAPDGNLWFVDTAGIGRITPAGEILPEFPVTVAPGAFLNQIVPGGDGNMWFDINGTAQAIGRVTPSGQITEVTPGMAGLNTGAVPTEMTTAPDGTVWFLDASTTKPAIGRITVNGAIKEFDYTGHPNPTLESIAPGADGNIWFTDRGSAPAVVKVAPDGTITPFSVGSMPDGLTPGSDGQMWFTDEGTPAAVGHVPESGPATESPNGLQVGSRPDAIILGSDGNTWFADQLSTSPMIGRVTPAAAVTEFPLSGPPQDLTLGIDGNVWATQINPSAIDRITPAGVVTPFTDGLAAGSDLTETGITVGPDGNLWFVDKGTPKAIARADVQLPPSASTGAASSIGTFTATVAGTVNPRGAPTTVSFQYGGSSVLGSTVAAGTLAASPTASPVSAALAALPSGSTVYYRVVASNAYGTVMGAIQTFRSGAVTPLTNPRRPGAATRTVTATLGNRRITLVIGAGAACTRKSRRLKLVLSASTIAHSRAARLRFVSAAVYLDRGVRHVRTRLVRGHRRRVVSYTANATVHKLPARRSLRLAGLRSGRHTLKVKLRFAKGKHVPARKTLIVRFPVC